MKTLLLLLLCLALFCRGTLCSDYSKINYTSKFEEMLHNYKVYTFSYSCTIDVTEIINVTINISNCGEMHYLLLYIFLLKVIVIHRQQSFNVEL